MWKPSTFSSTARSRSGHRSLRRCPARHFHDYFVTHLPSSSQHPDSRSPSRPSHKLPRDQSVPHEHGSGTRSPASMAGTRDTTVVRIPLRSAKHHFGASNARGTRPYNEDTYQAGTIDIPAFAKRAPVSLKARREAESEATGVDSASGDPQVFYFGIFDGHGGDQCSIFLREKLHEYLENAAHTFELKSTLQTSNDDQRKTSTAKTTASSSPKETEEEQDDEDSNTEGESAEDDTKTKPSTEEPSTEELERKLVRAWKDTVGGYFRRFKPEHFATAAGGQGHVLNASKISNSKLEPLPPPSPSEVPLPTGPAIDNVLTYAFLQADLDFVNKQAAKDVPPPPKASAHHDDQPINEADPHHHRPVPHPEEKKPPALFLGGSTCSIILVSTPSPSPFWHPASPCTAIVAHCGDTRIILCSTATGDAVPLTSDHHPSLPTEATRLRRYAGAFTTDSFGEERISGLANTRAFGDMRSKRLGVSAEPELRLVNLRAGECSFLVLVSDGVSGTLSDQEIVDVVKEARTPEEAARAVTGFATEVAGGEKGDADNATCLVVRMGGWERRSEGGVGSLGTKEKRDWRRQTANDPRAGRM